MRKKTSIYLTEVHLERLRALAHREGRSQADIIRDAILRYADATGGPRVFALDGVAQGPGGSVADLAEDELLTGFGS